MAYALQDQITFTTAKSTKITDISSLVNKTPKPKEPVKSKSIKVSNPVQPIKSKEDIQRIKDYFLNQKETYRNVNTGIRNYTMFCLNLNWALRCGDLVKLRIGDVLDTNRNIISKITVSEGKTGKHKTIFIPTELKSILRAYMVTVFDNYKSDDMQDEYLFFSRSGVRTTNNEDHKNHIKTDGFYKVMKKAQEDLQLDMNLGTHSVRKTFVYQKLTEYKNDAYMCMAVSKSLNHSSVGMTYHYAGFDEEVNKQLQTTNML